MTIENGRIWVPARYFALVAGMGFHSSGNKVRLKFLGRSLDFEVGSSRVAIDGTPLPNDQTIRLRNGRVMIPVSVVANAFKLQSSWIANRHILIINGQGLAAQFPSPKDFPTGIADNTRTLLAESHIGFDQNTVEVDGVIPQYFRWKWERGFYPRPTLNVRRVNFGKSSGLRLTLQALHVLSQRTFVVIGVGVDAKIPGGKWVSSVIAYGQYGYAYLTENRTEKDPNDREYCRTEGKMSIVCDVGPVLYSDPRPHPYSPNEIISVPRFVIARVYTR